MRLKIKLRAILDNEYFFAVYNLIKSGAITFSLIHLLILLNYSKFVEYFPGNATWIILLIVAIASSIHILLLKIYPKWTLFLLPLTSTLISLFLLKSWIQFLFIIAVSLITTTIIILEVKYDKFRYIMYTFPLVYFGLLFSIAVISNLIAENNLLKYYECSSDSDCISVKDSCGDRAINKIYLENYNKNNQYICRFEHDAIIGTPKCIIKRCTIDPEDDSVCENFQGMKSFNCYVEFVKYYRDPSYCEKIKTSEAESSYTKEACLKFVSDAIK